MTEALLQMQKWSGVAQRRDKGCVYTKFSPSNKGLSDNLFYSIRHSLIAVQQSKYGRCLGAI